MNIVLRPIKLLQFCGILTVMLNFALHKHFQKHPAQRHTPGMPHVYEYIEYNHKDGHYYDYPDVCFQARDRPRATSTPHYEPVEPTGIYRSPTTHHYEPVELPESSATHSYEPVEPTGISESSTYDESSLYAQFHKSQIPVIPRHTLKWV